MKIRMGKMMRLHLISVLVVGVCSMVRPAWATTAYVTDFFEITLRTGPSIENKIIAMIHTGQPVEILSSSERWSHVRLLGSEKGNKEGWVLNRFLVDHPPRKTQVRSFKEKNARLKEELSSSERKLSEALRREKDIRRRLNMMQKDVQRLTEENQQVKSSQQYKWFTSGALVLLCGLILGLVIGRKHRSKVFY